jgi:signal peptidase I
MRKKIHDNINGAGGRKSRLYVGWVVTIVIAFLIVIPVRRFCVESYRISTSAMEDALHQGDYILVNKLPLEGNPGRNKVVLFTSRDASHYQQGQGTQLLHEIALMLPELLERWIERV